MRFFIIDSKHPIHFFVVSEPMAVAPRPEVSSLLTDMLSAYSGVQQFLNQVESRDHRQVEEATRRTHGMLQEGLETGSRTLTTTGLLGLVSQCHTLRGKHEYALSERLQPYLDSLGHLIRRASDVLGMVECPLPDPTNYTAPAAKKRRRRLEERVEKSLTNDMQTAVVKSLRDPSNQRESHLSAAEHKLLCTIIPESALLPDIAAIRVYFSGRSQNIPWVRCIICITPTFACMTPRRIDRGIHRWQCILGFQPPRCCTSSHCTGETCAASH